MAARKADTAERAARGRRDRGRAPPSRSGTAAVGDVGNSLAAAPGIGAAGLRGRALPRAVRLARGRAPATRWPTPPASAPSAAAEPGPRASATSRAPHAPYSVGPELLAPHLRGRRRRRTRRPRSTSPRTKTSSRCCATARAAGRRCSPAWASTRARACPGKSPVAYLASLGAFADRDAAAAGAHGPRRRRRPRASPARPARPSCSARARTCTSAAACPTSTRCVADGVAARARHRQPGLGARPVAVGRDGDAGRALPGRRPRRAGSTPPPRGGARALGPARRSARSPPGKRPGVLDVLVDDVAAPLESLVRDPTPTLRWVARA